MDVSTRAGILLGHCLGLAHLTLSFGLLGQFHGSFVVAFAVCLLGLTQNLVAVAPFATYFLGCFD